VRLATRLSVPALIVLTLFPSVLNATECRLKPRKSIKIDGLLCGTVVSIDAYERMDGAEVVLLDSADVLVSSTRADSYAHFEFPSVPKGKYRIFVPGFSLYMSEVELTTSEYTMCKRPVAVYAGLSYCSGGFVSRKWDYGVFPDGPPPPNVK